MNYTSFKLVTGPASEPVSLDDIKEVLKIDTSDEDAYLSRLISAARTKAEGYTGKAFITQTWKLTKDGFGDLDYDVKLGAGVHTGARQGLLAGASSVFLPMLPLQSVSSIVSYDTDNTSATFASSKYTVDTSGGRVFLNQGETWPTNLRMYSAVEITYVSGYGDDASDVPQDIRTAIELLVKNMYECGGCDDMPASCKALLDPYVDMSMEWL